MTPVRAEKPESVEGSRPKTDYERWLEEKDKNYQIAESSEYHPPIPGIDGQVPLFLHPPDLDSSPRESGHLTTPDATGLRAHHCHGEFLHRLTARPPSPLKAVITEVLLESCVWQLALLSVVIVAFLLAVQRIGKRRCSGRTSLVLASSEQLIPDIDEKELA
ncbi:hypothetical protein BDV38DRAFT_243429 [Aspergillus pseudotamarii]|uniref:Uncharacterized protein n=1 Tax=Aspergillus pseudotamarii TaxID=132259 RepID=A0A5N6T0G9_ASPPS|nr:uncharacterized protein BDV38DRAFT_243429 [Aspergillus pseudotamarii]KAE8139014.1 hypothetical protein BDV38DRAFT_243429 [Aspergillus pseudotamarii]